MSAVPDHPPPVTVQAMELRLRMDATVTVYDAAGQPTDWLKPGSETAVWWNGIPSEQELVLRWQALTNANEATLSEVIKQIRQRLDAARKGERR